MQLMRALRERLDQHRLRSIILAPVLCFAAAGALIFASASAFAQQSGLRACYGVAPPPGADWDLRLMRLAGNQPQVHFRRDRTERMPGCPDKLPACRLPGFVKAGDLVLAGPDMERFVCAHHTKPGVRRVRGRYPQDIGFLPLDALEQVDVARPAINDWIGAWHRSSEAEIWIDPYTPGKIRIGGWATDGALDPERQRRGQVHIGALDGIAPNPSGNLLTVGEGYDGAGPPVGDKSDCQARLRLFGPYLVVEDNGGCGGPNVTFRGVYVRNGRQ